MDNLNETEISAINKMVQTAKNIRHKNISREQWQAIRLRNRVMKYILDNEEKLHSWAQTNKKFFIVQIPVLGDYPTLIETFQKWFVPHDENTFGGLTLYECEKVNDGTEYKFRLHIPRTEPSLGDTKQREKIEQEIDLNDIDFKEEKSILDQFQEARRQRHTEMHAKANETRAYIDEQVEKIFSQVRKHVEENCKKIIAILADKSIKNREYKICIPVCHGLTDNIIHSAVELKAIKERIYDLACQRVRRIVYVPGALDSVYEFTLRLE